MNRPSPYSRLSLLHCLCEPDLWDGPIEEIASCQETLTNDGPGAPSDPHLPRPDRLERNGRGPNQVPQLVRRDFERLVFEHIPSVDSVMD